MSIRYFLVYPGQNFNNLSKFNSNLILLKENNRLVNTESIQLLLEEDGFIVNDIDFIKYFNNELQGWVKMSSDLNLIIEDELQLQLIIKKNADTNEPKDEILKLVSSLESRLNELENKITDNYNQNEDEDSNIVHLAFLYSHPLVTKNKTTSLVPAIPPVDYTTEISNIISILKESGKKINIIIETATLENISSILLLKQPKILHLSLHGSFDESRNYFLNFEDQEGGLYKFNETTLSKISEGLSDEFSQIIPYNTKHSALIDIPLVFINSCHSEAIAECFLKHGARSVICINRNTKILDEASLSFSRNFYSSLIDGEAISKSFKKAKKFVSLLVDREPSCCCLHIHKQNCPWLTVEDKDSLYAHNLHAFKCKCNETESNWHKVNCASASSFISTLNLDKDKLLLGKEIIKLCCCSPELVHDENNKFLIKQRETLTNSLYLDMKSILFSNLSKGELTVNNKIVNKISKDPLFPYKSTIFGRNNDIFHIFNLFRLNIRLVTIYGMEGLGKKSMTKFLAHYMSERRFCEDGLIFINDYIESSANSKTSISEKFLLNKIRSSLGISINFNEIHSDEISSIYSLISHFRILIVINLKNLKNFKNFESVPKNMSKVLYEFLKKTEKSRILISSPTPLNIKNYETCYKLEPLSRNKISEILFLNGIEDEFLVDFCAGSPSKLHKIVSLFKLTGDVKKVINIIKNENTEKEEIQNLFLQYKMMSGKNYDILYILSLLPQGLSFEGFEFIFKHKDISLGTDNKSESISLQEHLDDLKSKFFISKSHSSDEVVYSLNEVLQSYIDDISSQNKSLLINLILDYYLEVLKDIIMSLIKKNEVTYEFSMEKIFTHHLNFFSSKVSCLKSISYKYIPNEETYLRTIEENIVSIVKRKEIVSGLQNKSSLIWIAMNLLTIFILTKKMNEYLNFYEIFLPLFTENESGKAWLILSKANFSFIVNKMNLFRSRSSFDWTNDKSELESLGEAEEIFISLKDESALVQLYHLRAVISFNQGIIFEKNLVQHLMQTIEFYRSSNNKYSLGSLYMLLSEILLSSLNQNSNLESCLNYLKEALNIYTANTKRFAVQIIKTHLMISKYYLSVKNSQEALKHAEYAQNYQKKVNLTGIPSSLILLNRIKRECSNMMTDINQYLDNMSQNIISILTFFPKNDAERETSSNLITYNDLYFEIIKHKIIKNCGEVSLSISINELNTENLANEVNKKGKILVIISQDNDTELTDLVDRTLLQNNKTFKDSHQTNYELIILAIASLKFQELSEKLISTKITQRVLYFSFSESFTSIIPFSHIGIKDTIYSAIKHSTFSFIFKSLCNFSFKDSLNVAKKDFESYMKLFLNEIKYIYLNNKEVLDIVNNLSYEVKLVTQSTAYDLVNLFEKSTNPSGILDRGQIKSNTFNFPTMKSIIGRKDEICSFINIVKSNSLVNLHGELGSGKTSFVSFIVTFMKSDFLNGIFYLDLVSFSSIESLSNSLQEILMQLENECQKKVLIVLDNIDYIYKNYESSLFLLLASLDKNMKTIHFMMITIEKMNSTCHMLVKDFPLRQLNDEESVAFILFYVERQINIEEIDYEERSESPLKKYSYNCKNCCKTLFDVLKLSPRIKVCKGNVRCLKKLANLLNYKSLDKVRYNEYLDKNLIKKLKDTYERESMFNSIPIHKISIKRSESREDKNKTELKKNELDAPSTDKKLALSMKPINKNAHQVKFESIESQISNLMKSHTKYTPENENTEPHTLESKIHPEEINNGTIGSFRVVESSDLMIIPSERLVDSRQSNRANEIREHKKKLSSILKTPFSNTSAVKLKAEEKKSTQSIHNNTLGESSIKSGKNGKVTNKDLSKKLNKDSRDLANIFRKSHINNRLINQIIGNK